MKIAEFVETRKKLAIYFTFNISVFDMSQKSILENILSPKDLKILSLDQLSILSDELRSELISSVSKTGGHLGAGLGVIELTIALHYIFNAPKDKIIWDVGHQAYPHKILTGRKENEFSQTGKWFVRFY